MTTRDIPAPDYDADMDEHEVETPEQLARLVAGWKEDALERVTETVFAWLQEEGVPRAELAARARPLVRKAYLQVEANIISHAARIELEMSGSLIN